MNQPAPFVSTAWLAERLGTPGIAIVDASWYLPDQKRDPRAEFLAGHIPGAVHFDIDRIADTSSGLPHMMPAPEAFVPRLPRRDGDRDRGPRGGRGGGGGYGGGGYGGGGGRGRGGRDARS